jgi:hypothetical protein
VFVNITAGILKMFVIKLLHSEKPLFMQNQVFEGWLVLGSLPNPNWRIYHRATCTFAMKEMVHQIKTREEIICLIQARCRMKIKDKSADNNPLCKNLHS